MEVILAETLGYCGGVKKAVDLIYNTLEKVSGKDIIMNGPIIHNNSIINDLQEKGVGLADDSTDIDGKKVVIRAHGVTPVELTSIEKRGGTIVDGTCPIVKSSQKKIKKYFDEGYFIVISGDKGHAEVIGLVGFAPGKSIVVDSVEDLEKHTYPEKTVLISQTTFSKPEFYKIEDALKQLCPNLKTLCTICGATKDRQKAVIELAEKVDAVIVIGGVNSSNTKRLKMVAEEFVPAWLIEDKMGIPQEIYKYERVGITAGASTPDFVIEGVVNTLEST